MGEKNACYKDPYWFISAVAGGRKILIGNWTKGWVFEVMRKQPK